MRNTVVSKQVRHRKGPTPAPSDHPSRPSFDTAKEALREELRKPPKNHEVAKTQVSLFIGDFSCLKRKTQQALERDRYRCALTGKIDSRSYLSGLVAVTDLANEQPGSTQATHIFSPSINKDHRKGNNKVSQAIFSTTGLITV